MYVFLLTYGILTLNLSLNIMIINNIINNKFDEENKTFHYYFFKILDKASSNLTHFQSWSRCYMADVIQSKFEIIPF